MSLLLKVDLSVPSSPGLKGSEHSTLTTHVTEGTLTGSVGTTSTNSGNSGNGSTGTPRFGRVLHTGLRINSVSLSSVLRDVSVNELDDVESDGSSENAWKRVLDFKQILHQLCFISNCHTFPTTSLTLAWLKMLTSGLASIFVSPKFIFKDPLRFYNPKQVPKIYFLF